MLQRQIMQVLKETWQFHKCAFQAPLHKQVSNKLYSNPSGVPICIKILLFCQRTFLCQLPFMCELKRPPRAFYILSHGCLEGISSLMTFCLWMISDFQRAPICHSFYLVMIWWNQVTLQGFLQGLSILLWNANTEETCVPEMPLNCEGTSSCTGFSDIVSIFAVGLSHQPNRLSSSWRYYVN